MIILQIIKKDHSTYMVKFDNMEKCEMYYNNYIKQQPECTIICTEIHDFPRNDGTYGYVHFFRICKKEFQPVRDESGQIKTRKTEDGDIIAIMEEVYGVYNCN